MSRRRRDAEANCSLRQHRQGQAEEAWPLTNRRRCLSWCTRIVIPHSELHPGDLWPACAKSEIYI